MITRNTPQNEIRQTKLCEYAKIKLIKFSKYIKLKSFVCLYALRCCYAFRRGFWTKFDAQVP